MFYSGFSLDGSGVHKVYIFEHNHVIRQVFFGKGWGAGGYEVYPLILFQGVA